MKTPLSNIRNEARLVRLRAGEKSAMRARLTHATAEGIFAALPKESPVRITRSSYSFFSLRFAMPMGALLVVLLGAGTTYAAQGSLPGSPLYTVKLSVNEPVREALAFSSEAKAAFHASAAQERLKEAEELASEGRLDATVSAQLVENLNIHVAEAQSIAMNLEEENPTVAMEVAIQVDSSLDAHGDILSHLSEESKDESTKENSRALAQEVRQHGSHKATAPAPTAMALSKTAAPTTETFAVSVASDTEVAATTTAHSSSENSSQKKAAKQFKKKAHSALESVHGQFNSLRRNLSATTTASVKARLSSLDTALDAADEAYESEDYAAAADGYNQGMRDTIELATFLTASKKFDKELLPSLLRKYDTNKQDEVKGEIDESKAEVSNTGNERGEWGKGKN